MARKNSKKRKANKQPASLSEKFSQMPTSEKRRFLLKSVVGLGAMGVGAAALSNWDQNNREMHDLSTLGSGNPVVVQIHDTSCPVCRRLKTVTSAALNDRDEIDYRVADLASSEGRELANKYGAQKTTLLFFDGSGRHVHTSVGMRTAEEIDGLVAAHL